MDEDKVVTPMDENTLEQTTGFDGTKSKESASLLNLWIKNLDPSLSLLQI